jgi:uncharacterized protein (DUF1697 family)
MEKYIALFRGINVSGQKMINMEDLKSHMKVLNFTNVITYIQSGNLIFEYEKTHTAVLAQSIKNKIQEVYGFEVAVMVKSDKEIKYIADNNPFLNERNEDIQSLHVTLFSEVPKTEFVHRLVDFKDKSDEFILFEDVAYLYCPKGYGNTKFTNTYFENKCKVEATTRNWKTIRKLVELTQ